MYKGILLGSAAVISAISMSACSIKSSGDGALQAVPPNTGFFDSKATIQGPTVEGEWESACFTKPDDSSRRFKIKFEGETVSRDELDYTDADCSKLSSENLFTGRFRFIDSFNDGSFGVEYAFDLGNGGHTYPQEKILLDETELYISNFSTGEMATVLKDEPLYLAPPAPRETPPTTKPAPKPTPAPKVGEQAVLATSFTEAKYAICNVQGTAVLVDFLGNSVAHDGKGLAKVGFKSCNTNAPFQWRKESTEFTVTVTDGYPRISFHNISANYPDNIRTSSVYKGLDGWMETFASFGGNTGGCFFTTNGGTEGAPFTDQCD